MSWNRSTRVVLAAVATLSLTHCSASRNADASLFSVRPLLRTAKEPGCVHMRQGNLIEGVVPAQPPVDGAPCVDVGAAIVDSGNIATAVLAGAGAPPGTVNIRLDGSGAKAFDRYAATHLGQRLAIMDQSVVVATPTLASPTFHGTITFTTNTTDAARFVAAVKRS